MRRRQENGATVVADVEGAIFVFITPTSGQVALTIRPAEWSTCVRLIVAIRLKWETEGGGGGGGQNTGEKRRDALKEKGQTLRGKRTWLPASGMSAASRLAAIHYPSLLKYYAHWLMLTAWPEGGDCVGKCVCLHLVPAASKSHFYRQNFCKQHDCKFLEGFWDRCLWEALVKSTMRN